MSYHHEKLKDLTLINFAYNEKEPCVPVGCLYLISWLRRYGFTVDFRDLQLSKSRNPFAKKNILSFFQNTSDIIGISCMPSTLPIAIWVCKQIRKDSPKKIIILGGSGPSLVAKEIINNFSYVDIVVIGPGEHALIELIGTLKSGESIDQIKGIVFRQDGNTVLTPPREAPSRIESAFTAFDAVDLSKYKNIHLFSGRGCSNNCPFCAIKSLYHGSTPRDIADIEQEFDYILRCKNGFDYIGFQDEDFLFNKNRFLKLCQMVKRKRKKGGVRLFCYAKIDLLDKENMLTLSNSGFSDIFIGVESGSDRVLRLINKKYTIKAALKVLLEAKKYFSVVWASFIGGFPFEEVADFLETCLVVRYLLMKEIKAILNSLEPVPGTKLYNLYKDKLQYYNRFINLISVHVAPITRLPHIAKFIVEYPDVFPFFYHYHTKNLDAKYKIFERIHK